MEPIFWRFIIYDIINYVSNDNLIINEQNRSDFKNYLYQIDINIDNLFDNLPINQIIPLKIWEFW
jgi:hypothetical protein